MKEKIGIRFLTQFIVMCLIRLFISESYYSEMNVTVTLIMLAYAFLFTLLLESFDRFIVHYVKYSKYMAIVMGICLAFLVFKGETYDKFIFGYLLIVMLKDLWKSASMQLSLEEFQHNYENKSENH